MTCSPMVKNTYLSKIRALSIALFVSGACNIILVVFAFYWVFKEVTPQPYCEQKPAAQKEQLPPLASEKSNIEVILSFKNLSTEQLIGKLTHLELIENGYTQRDLALAYLVAFHQFDLSKAISGQPPPSQQRSITLGKAQDGSPIDVVVYPELSEEHFHSIVCFANTEQWPLTSKGLFDLICNTKGTSLPPGLANAFFLTSEFLAVETLFNRSDSAVAKEEILAVLRKGDWAMLKSFSQQQKITQDLSAARRQRFLLDYIALQSKEAAYLLLKTDGDFVLKKLDNEHILAILTLLTHKNDDAEHFALQLLTSPRSDAVWQLAAAKLFEYAGEQKPDKALHHMALMRFVPQIVIAVPKEVKEVKENEIVKAKNSPPSPLPLPAPMIKKPPEKAAAAKTKPSTPTPTPTPMAISSSSPISLAHPKAKPKPLMYTVQYGDSIWKIAKRFQTNPDLLKSYNQLSSDNLKPGTLIKIPPQ